MCERASTCHFIILFFGFSRKKWALIGEHIHLKGVCRVLPHELIQKIDFTIFIFLRHHSGEEGRRSGLQFIRVESLRATKMHHSVPLMHQSQHNRRHARQLHRIYCWFHHRSLAHVSLSLEFVAAVLDSGDVSQHRRRTLWNWKLNKLILRLPWSWNWAMFHVNTFLPSIVNAFGLAFGVCVAIRTTLNTLQE